MELRVEQIHVQLDPQYEGDLDGAVVSLRCDHFALHRRVTLWPSLEPSFSVTHIATGKKFPTEFQSLKDAKRFLVWIDSRAPRDLAVSVDVAKRDTKAWEQMRELWREFMAEYY